MKKHKYLFGLFMLFTLIFLIVGCARKDSKVNSNTSSETTTKNKPLNNLSSIVGKKFMFAGSYKGKQSKNIDSIPWKKSSGNYSFIIVNEKKVFVGKYIDGRLNYGHIYQVKKLKNHVFQLEAKSFITASSNYDKMNKKVKLNYTKADNKKIPDANNKERYYIADKFKGNNKKVNNRFYFVKGSLVRESKANQGTYYYTKNVVKK